MKSVHNFLGLTPLLLVILGLAVSSCETIIDPKLSDAEPVIVIDAWLDNKSDNQIITLTKSQGYFDASPLVAINGASVEVLNVTTGEILVFNEQGNSGKYVWTPATPGERYSRHGRRRRPRADGRDYSMRTKQWDSSSGAIP